MQVLLGDLTTEQFAQLIGVVFACFLFALGIFIPFTALLHGICDGWLFRKGALYYGSFRLLNVKFRALKSCGTLQELNRLYNEICMAVTVFQYQRTIPKALCDLVMIKLNKLYELRDLEVYDLSKLLKTDNNME